MKTANYHEDNSKSATIYSGFNPANDCCKPMIKLGLLREVQTRLDVEKCNAH